MTAFLVKSHTITTDDIQRLLYAEVDMIVAAQPAAATRVASMVQHRCSVGLSCEAIDLLNASVLDGSAVDALFIALSPGAISEEVLLHWRSSAAHRPLTAVVAATDAVDTELWPFLKKCGFDGVMLDAGFTDRLPDLLPPHQLITLAEEVRASGLTIGFSGGLESPDVVRLLSARPDMLCFDLADMRDSDVQEIRVLIPRGSPSAAHSVMVSGLTSGRDWIFVQDFVLPVEIGAYRREHGSAQRVRFDVTAEIARSHPASNAGGPTDMRDVVSYDLIMDGIRHIVARGLVVLAEALAEAVAEHVLALDRVLSVRVRVEKLDIAPCRVGVEIERIRNTAPRGS